MNKKDVLELKRRFKKTECTFTRMCGCYVDCEKNIVLNIEETFLNLADEEFYKYLEIAKKTLSGTIGNNLLELDFPLDEEKVGGRQQFLMGLRESRLKNEGLLDTFYKLIIDSYDYAGNFLIIIFHDAYDVITKTSDNAKLDESEEVYDYLLCAICPVSLTKPGLGYLEDENRIGVRLRDWVVGAPETGFIFPAFTDRSTDIHSLMYYTKNAKEPHPEFMEAGLGCISKQTATEQKETFHSLLRSALNDGEGNNNDLILEIQDTLSGMIEEQEAIGDKNKEPMTVTSSVIQEVLLESGVSEELSAKIEQSYVEEFGTTPPIAEHLIDTKAIAAYAEKKKEHELVQQVHHLQQKLEEVGFDEEKESSPEIMETNKQLETDKVFVAEAPSSQNYDVVLRVKPEKVSQIKSQFINGKKCIVIPMEDDEHANVNGVTADL